ncbi:hypothetical protein [Flaviaesturariibacter amylovorans]|uniref:DUF695 domain-containing protein n=1 Tax=Flaviaesturariibacter amylovorans TaxID=1084520 RepID=A0ABP8G5K3_9BACT
MPFADAAALTAGPGTRKALLFTRRHPHPDCIGTAPELFLHSAPGRRINGHFFFDMTTPGPSQRPLPEAYEGTISAAEYNDIMNLALRYHEEHGIAVTGEAEGTLITEMNDQQQHRFLDNLVRLLAISEKSEWKELIWAHFDKLKDHSAAYAFLYKDFEYAEPLLRVLVKPGDFEPGLDADLDGFVHREDLPGTWSFLIIEYEGQLDYVSRDDIGEWEKPEEELFASAIANTPAEEIEIEEYLFAERFTVYGIFSGDYAAALVLDLERRLPDAIGPYGALVAVPSKGAAFAHPIATSDVMELVGALYANVDQIWSEGQGPISRDFYWLYEGQFELFHVAEDEEEGDYIEMPARLRELLSEAEEEDEE